MENVKNGEKALERSISVHFGIGDLGKLKSSIFSSESVLLIFFTFLERNRSCVCVCVCVPRIFYCWTRSCQFETIHESINKCMAMDRCGWLWVNQSTRVSHRTLFCGWWLSIFFFHSFSFLFLFVSFFCHKTIRFVFDESKWLTGYSIERSEHLTMTFIATNDQ